jgi:hypothetical protein
MLCFQSIDLGFLFHGNALAQCLPSSLKGKQYMHAARCPGVASVKKSAALGLSILHEIQGIPGGRFGVSTLCIQRGYLQTDVALVCGTPFKQPGICWKTEQKMIDEDERLVYPFQITTAQKKNFEVVDDIPPKVVSTIEKVRPYRELYTSGKSERVSRVCRVVCTDH